MSGSSNTLMSTTGSGVTLVLVTVTLELELVLMSDVSDLVMPATSNDVAMTAIVSVVFVFIS